MIGAKHILLVDDDNDLRQALAEQLALYDEFVTYQAASGGAAIEAAKEGGHDLIVLDVGLPDLDGREVCRLLRRSGVKAPIVMLTASASDSDTILGLEAGANDYVAKPVRFHVLLARIRAHLRQHEMTEDAVFPVGGYTFKPAAKILIDAAGKKVWLTDKETAILKYLKRAQGRAVSREVLLDEVWGYNAGVTTHTLETHIYRLRQKIEKNPSDAQLLVTESGGYKLVG
ncbi:MAG: response regulator transcription factor [Sphingomonadales bacterium]|nr:response regulator transcription factor [Sphingomonadales bacterium]